MADLKRLNEFASIGRDFIGLQFRLTPDKATRSIDQLWVLGYCYGVLDAVRQTAQLEESGEGVALIAVGFFLLMVDEAKGADRMRQALKHASDPRFAQGSLLGGNDMFAWLADTARAPTGLSKHVNGSPSENQTRRQISIVGSNPDQKTTVISPDPPERSSSGPV